MLSLRRLPFVLFKKGGTFTLQSLGNGENIKVQIPQMGAPVVIETNKVTTMSAPASDVRVADGAGGFKPKPLWPSITNFPTFDSFYFHTDGNVYPLQMSEIPKSQGFPPLAATRRTRGFS